MVVSPPTTSSTPSSPNRHVSLGRNRSHSFNAGLVGKAEEADDDSGNESIWFNLTEGEPRCKKEHEHCFHENNAENQTPRDERTCKSRDHDDVTSVDTRDIERTAEMSTQSNKAPLHLRGVKPSVTKRPVEKVTDESTPPQPPSVSTVASTRSAGSSNIQQTSQRVNSGVGTRTKTRPTLANTQTRRPSEAITDITQAKKLTHRAVVARRLQKTSDLTADCKVVQRRRQNEQLTAAAATTLSPNGTTVDEVPKSYTLSKPVCVTQQSTGRDSSGRDSRAKVRSSLAEEHTRRPTGVTTNNTQDKKEERDVTINRSEKTPAVVKESLVQQHDLKPVAKTATRVQDQLGSSRPEMKAAVRSKPDTGANPPASNAKQYTSTRSEKSFPSKPEPSQPVISVSATAAADDDDDEDDLENLITALRDPDDVRHRKTEPRRPSGWNLWITKLSNSAKDEKQTTTEDHAENYEVHNVCNI